MNHDFNLLFCFRRMRTAQIFIPENFAIAKCLSPENLNEAISFYSLISLSQKGSPPPPPPPPPLPTFLLFLSPPVSQLLVEEFYFYTHTCDKHSQSVTAHRDHTHTQSYNCTNLTTFILPHKKQGDVFSANNKTNRSMTLRT